MSEPARACLHCALARALRVEGPAFRQRGLDVRLNRSDPVFLPATGAALYRGLRRLLAGARAAAERGEVKLTVLDLPGKSHVEVTAVVASGATVRVLSHAFPCYDPATLPNGFAEHA
jgi:hypothetical protein